MHIASRYFDLFRHFGGLPIIRGTYGVEAEYEYQEVLLMRRLSLW